MFNFFALRKQAKLATAKYRALTEELNYAIDNVQAYKGMGDTQYKMAVNYRLAVKTELDNFTLELHSAPYKSHLNADMQRIIKRLK